MAKNDKLKSRKGYRMTDSPEPLVQFDWDSMENNETPRRIHLSGVPSFSAIVAALLFIVLIIFIIYF